MVFCKPMPGANAAPDCSTTPDKNAAKVGVYSMVDEN